MLSAGKKRRANRHYRFFKCLRKCRQLGWGHFWARQHDTRMPVQNITDCLNRVISRKLFSKKNVLLAAIVLTAIVLLVTRELMSWRFPSSDYMDLSEYFGVEIGSAEKNSVPVQVWRSGDYLKTFGEFDGGKNLRILCWISTFPGNIELALIVFDTWGRHCSDFYIFTTKSGKSKNKNTKNGSLPRVVALDVSPQYVTLWKRTQLAIKTIGDEGKEFDFVLKADDDTFVVWPNLLDFLRKFNPEERLFIGHPLHKPCKGAWMSGGAGYIMTGSAFNEAYRFMSLEDGDASGEQMKRRRRLMGTRFLNMGHVAEDVAVGAVMAATGARFIAAQDFQNRHLLSVFKASVFTGGKPVPAWYPPRAQSVNYHNHKIKNVEDLASPAENLISLHYVERTQMMLALKDVVEKWNGDLVPSGDILSVAGDDES